MQVCAGGVFFLATRAAAPRKKGRARVRTRPVPPQRGACRVQFVGVITISTLRFSARPAMGRLVAIGSPKPCPETMIRVEGVP